MLAVDEEAIWCKQVAGEVGKGPAALIPGIGDREEFDAIVQYLRRNEEGEELLERQWQKGVDHGLSEEGR